MRACWSAHLVQFGLGAGEGEGEAHRKLFVLDVLLLHEVAQTVGHVAEELKVQRNKVTQHKTGQERFSSVSLTENITFNKFFMVTLISGFLLFI